MLEMNLYLIGYRGSGKTIVAPLLAKQLGWTAHDTDSEVVLLAGCPISQMFAEYGESCFREWETTVIEALSRQSNLVVSTGGGAPLAEANRQRMAGTGRVIWLQASPIVLWKRISADAHADRPDLTDQGGLEEVKQVLAARCEIYDACADYKLNVESLSPEQIAERIAEWWDPVDS